MPLAPGTRLGPYEILAPIGAGGMGEVYKARDTRLDRIVAVKTSTEQFSARFERETRVIAALNHPHICQLYDVGPNYLVMEFIEGAPLKGPLPLDQALKYATQICEALEAAHKKGITHRDLKPGNILVSVAGVKLLDFGLAQVGSASKSDDGATQTTDLTQAGTILGTAAYMSPEQAQAKPVDARSDIFSFGVVLYEMLSGRRAFNGDSAIAIIAAVLHKEPASLDAPPELREVVARCLRKSPEGRFQSATELLASLGSVSANQPAEQPPSIAVLPFANMSRDPDDEYFSDGLAEEILNALTHTSGLKVIARSSAFTFKGRHEDVRRVAEILGVTHVLEGSVRRAGNRIRITAQLVTASDGSQLWSERYDRELADVFAVQEEIATAIARTLQMKLAAAARAYTPKLAAYEELLKARHYFSKWNPESAAKGQECLKRAIDLDPGFALPYCELGWIRFILVTENRLTPREGAALMRAEAEQALKIDPSLTEAHAVLAMVAVLAFDWNEAGRQFQLALAREPIRPSVRYFYSLWFLAPLSRIEEAREQMERALREDPLNTFFRVRLGDFLLASGHSSEGEATERQALELDPNHWLPYLWLGVHALAGGQLSEAFNLIQQCYSLAPWNAVVTGLLAGLSKRKGDETQAQRLIEKFGDGTVLGAPAGFVAYHVAVGEIDRAADWYERAIEQNDVRTPHLLASLFGNLLTSSPRWPKLAKMMNLPGTV